MTKIPAPNCPLLNYREARPCPGSCRHQAPCSITQWVWGQAVVGRRGVGGSLGVKVWSKLSRAPGVWGSHLNIMLWWSLSIQGTGGLTWTTWVPIQALRLYLPGTEVATSPQSLIGGSGQRSPSSLDGCVGLIKCIGAVSQGRTKQVCPKHPGKLIQSEPKC